MGEENLARPFIYANGKKCSGHVFRWRTYGGENYETARKVRLWCSDKGDHQGILNNGNGKRMEFYPDELPDEILDAVFPNKSGSAVRGPRRR